MRFHSAIAIRFQTICAAVHRFNPAGALCPALLCMLAAAEAPARVLQYATDGGCPHCGSFKRDRLSVIVFISELINHRVKIRERPIDPSGIFVFRVGKSLVGQRISTAGIKNRRPERDNRT